MTTTESDELAFDEPGFSTTAQLVDLARGRLTSPLREFVFSAAGTGGTRRRNRASLDRLVVDQRIPLDEDPVDTSVTFLGAVLPSPVLAGPVGIAARLWPEGDRALAAGWGADGSVSTVSANASAPVERLAADAGAPVLLQMHHAGIDPDVQRDLLARAAATPGYLGACITVHSTKPARLDAHIAARVAAGESPVVPPRSPDARFTWDAFDRFRDLAGDLPLGVKGVMSAVDAREAVDRGAAFVWVGNHGARLLDEARASVDALEDVVAAVGGRVPVVVDSGFRGGTDALKAIARGATLVAYGTLPTCGLVVGGAGGVARVRDILRAELDAALVHSGRTSLAQVGPDLLSVEP